MSHNCVVVPGRGWRLAFAAARSWLGLLTVLVALAWSGAAFAAPVITSISPDSRLLSEETASIYIYGTGFTGAWDNTDVSVSVGGQPAGFAYVTNASEMGAFFLRPRQPGRSTSPSPPRTASATPSSSPGYPTLLRHRPTPRFPA